MVQSNELRIGNIFESVVIESITKTGVNFSAQYEGYSETPFESLKPIPLTPEVLEKCGFAKENEIRDAMWTLGDFDIEPEDDGFAVFASEWTIGKPFHYLHQLQNLYFALTGTELTYTP